MIKKRQKNSQFKTLHTSLKLYKMVQITEIQRKKYLRIEPIYSIDMPSDREQKHVIIHLIHDYRWNIKFILWNIAYILVRAYNSKAMLRLLRWLWFWSMMWFGFGRLKIVISPKMRSSHYLVEKKIGDKSIERKIYKTSLRDARTHTHTLIIE